MPEAKFQFVMIMLALAMWGRAFVRAEDLPQDEAARAQATLENGRLEAASYVLKLAGQNDRDAPIKLKSESLLKWQNSVNKSVHGNVFVWTKDGRPELVSSIFQFYSPRVEFSAEFQSLSLCSLVMEKDGRTVWTPKEPGVVLKPFDDAAEPAASKPARLRQMRHLAEPFQAELTLYTGETHRLRLMPQPLFRYESTDPQLLDGGLFAFTYTTDPEVLLVVEARKMDDRFQWQFGLARMHGGEIKVTYRDREIWRAKKLLPPYFFQESNYCMFSNLPPPKGRESN